MYKKKGEKAKMPRKSIIIDDYLDNKIKEYITRYKMTYTSLVTIAIHKYFDSMELQEKFKLAFAETIKDAKDNTPKIR